MPFGPVGDRLRAAFESGDFEPLTELYADDALLDWTMPGRRSRVSGPEAIVLQLGEWWTGSGKLTRWSQEEFPSGLTIEFERERDGTLARQRHFLQLRDGSIVRHQAYCARPLGALVSPPPSPVAERILAGLGSPVVERGPLLHPGQTGGWLDRVVLADGRRLVVKRAGRDWLSAVTRDPGREVLLWTSGALARLPDEIDPAIVAAGLDDGLSVLVMCDVSDLMLGAFGRRLSREESRRLLGAAGTIHRTFAGERLDFLCSLSDFLRVCGPGALADTFETDMYIPKVMAVGWEVFAETADADVVDAIAAVHADPAPLACALGECGTTLVHGDLRGANLGVASDRIVVLDWQLATAAPGAVDLGWYLYVNGWRIDATREQLIDDFRAAGGDLFDERALELALVGALAWHGGLLSHELIESSDEKRAQAREELDWWVKRVRRGLERL